MKSLPVAWLLTFVSFAPCLHAADPSAGSSPQFMDLAKTPMWREHALWVGKPVASVLPPSSISRLVLLEAVTSATADLDGLNIRRLLAAAGRFERPPQPLETGPSIWHVLIDTADGRTFQLRVYGQWALLVSPDGHGYFTLPKTAPA